MKTTSKYILTVFLCAFFTVSLHACGGSGNGSSESNTNSQNALGDSIARLHANSQNPLLGTWISGEHNLTFKSDNTYLHDFNHEGIPAVRGHVMVSGNLIIVTDSEGRQSCINSTDGNGVSGFYTYAVSNNTLTFALFYDPCSDRSAILRLAYTKQ